MPKARDGAAPQKRKRRHFRDLHPSIRQDINESLDQIVALGSEIKSVSQYHPQKDQISDNTTLDVKQRAKRRRRLYEQEGDDGLFIHSEDRAVYAPICNFVKQQDRPFRTLINQQKQENKEPQIISMFTFPHTKRQGNRTCNENGGVEHAIDAGWEELYGDGISEKEFRNHLSSHTKSGTDDTSSNGWKLPESISKSNTDEDDDPVQDMIENAWQRAVHMASTTMNVTTMKTDNEEASTSTKIARDEEKVDGYDKDDVVNGIGTDEEQESSNSMYEVNQKQGDQYDERSTLITNILKREATNVIDSILETVLTYVQQFKKEEEPFRWTDVMDCFQTVMNDMKANCDAFDEDEVTPEERITQTVQINSNLLPIPLNEEVVNNAFARLRQRYDINAVRDSIL